MVTCCYLSHCAFHEQPGMSGFLPLKPFSRTISAGDVIKLTVTASSEKSGTAKIENLTNGQTVSEDLTSNAALCLQDAEWIVEDLTEVSGLAPLANFGTVTFTNAEASGTGTYTPSGAAISDIEQNGQVLTSTSIDGSSVTIEHM